MVGYAIRRVALSVTHVPSRTKEDIFHPRMRTDDLLIQEPVQAETHATRKGAMRTHFARLYGLHLPHGVYPADVASSLDANCIWFFSAGRLLQVGLWNT